MVFKIPLNGNGKTNLYWTIDYHKKLLHFEVHLPLPRISWFAIGFSDYGALNPADFCILWTDWKKRVHFEDAWTSENGRISVDESQDCTDFHYVTRGEMVKFGFYRKFTTCDPKDYEIEDGTIHIVWARGEGPLFKLEGVNISSAQQSGFERTQLLKNINAKESHPSDTWTLEILAHNVKVPGVETTYWCHVHELPRDLIKKHHIIQYEPVIQKGNEHLVHHMEVFQCVTGVNDTIPKYVGSCFADDRPDKTKVCKRVIAAWAMGAQAFSYPEEAGLPIGGPDYNRFVMLEVHYNNPELKADWVDSSGIRFYLTPSLRKYDGGVMELGLEYTDKMAIPPGQERFQLSGYCITECTAIGLPERGIVVFGSQLHTHLLGTQVYTKHIRNGVELAELNRDNKYSTHFQEIRRLKRLVRVLPGDALITTCTFKSSNKENVTLGGFSITDEMCVNYIHYYPKTNLEVCKSSVSYGNLFDYFDYLQSYENQNTDSEKAISENYNEIEWTPLRVEVLNDLYTNGRISMQCNQSSGERFPGDWEDMTTTKILRPLKVRKPCGN
ncbi:hypothetical protein RUM43_010997 [Polyplax serrata]|uniref:Dopamine beta-hydroxylase n=1 Tax=Polyplax serrata TaxID=468196 RepID=A0AAN8S0N7_POLSC